MIVELPPESFDTEQRDYLRRMFREVLLTTQQSNYFPITNYVPDKVKVGKVYYFSRSIGAITSEGFWGYISTGWVKLG